MNQQTPNYLAIRSNITKNSKLVFKRTYAGHQFYDIILKSGSHYILCVDFATQVYRYAYVNVSNELHLSKVNTYTNINNIPIMVEATHVERFVKAFKDNNVNDDTGTAITDFLLHTTDTKFKLAKPS